MPSTARVTGGMFIRGGMATGMRDAGWWMVLSRGGFFFFVKVSFEPGFVEGSKPAHEEENKEDG